MHPECMNFLDASLRDHAKGDTPWRVLEFGSRNVNGSPRELFGNFGVRYVGVDIEDGPGVDIVDDAARCLIREQAFDVVICAEVAEHTPDWALIVENAYRHLAAAGLFLFTAACDPRPPHSAVDGHNMEPGEFNDTWPGPRGRETFEYYRNIDPNELAGVLANAGFHDIKVRTLPRGDVQASAIR